jgi:hypothetical protein
MGILGVAWGTVIPCLASSLLFWPWYVRRTLGINPLTYMVSAWLRPAIGIVPFVLATYAVERYWPADHLVFFFLEVAAILPLAVAGYWLVCFDQPTRENYSRKFFQSFDRVFARS